MSHDDPKPPQWAVELVFKQLEGYDLEMSMKQIFGLAQLLADERERCAKICEEMGMQILKQLMSR